MKPKRKTQYAIRRKTSGLTKDDVGSNGRHMRWWSETVRMVDAGFLHFFESRGMPVPRVSEHFAESWFPTESMYFGATRRGRSFRI